MARQAANLGRRSAVVAANRGPTGPAKVAAAPRGESAGHVAVAPSGDTGHVAAAPRGPAAHHVAVGLRSPAPAADIIIPTGVSTDAGNILALGSDSKPYLSCVTVNACFTGPIVGRTFTF